MKPLYAAILAIALVGLVLPAAALCPCGNWGDRAIGHCHGSGCCQEKSVWFFHYHRHGSPVCPSSGIFTFTDNIWSSRCSETSLVGEAVGILHENTTYTITITAQHGLDGAGICYGQSGGDWNYHVDEQRLSSPIVAFVIRNPLDGVRVRAVPMFNNSPSIDGTMTVNINGESTTYPGSFDVLYKVIP